MLYYQPPRKLVQQAVDQWPVTLELVKQHCRIQFNDDDDYLNHLIAVAVDYIEAGADITLPVTRYRYRLDTWPVDCRVLLPLSPARQIESVSYTDVDGEVRGLMNSTLDARLIGTNGVVVLNVPQPTDAALDQPVMIDYTAGHGDLDITDEPDNSNEYPFEFGDPIVLYTDQLDWPKIAIQAALIGVQHFYENREAVVIGTISSEMPVSFNSCIARMRVHGL